MWGVSGNIAMVCVSVYVCVRYVCGGPFWSSCKFTLSSLTSLDWLFLVFLFFLFYRMGSGHTEQHSVEATEWLVHGSFHFQARGSRRSSLGCWHCRTHLYPLRHLALYSQPGSSWRGGVERKKLQTGNKICILECVVCLNGILERPKKYREWGQLDQSQNTCMHEWMSVHGGVPSCQTLPRRPEDFSVEWYPANL